MKNKLDELGLNQDNSCVIGSGILQALGIRESKDIDVVVSEEMFNTLKQSGKFTVGEAFGHEILRDDIFEIGAVWNVSGKPYKLEDLKKESTIIDDVQYVSLEFLYQVKKSWATLDDPRQKDIDDVKLIEKYIQDHEHTI